MRPRHCAKWLLRLRSDLTRGLSPAMGAADFGPQAHQRLAAGLIAAKKKPANRPEGRDLPVCSEGGLEGPQPFRQRIYVREPLNKSGAAIAP